MLGGPVLASIVTTAPAGEGGNVQALRSLQQVRSFISSPVMLLLIDAPLAPLYFAVVFLIHRDLGFIALGAGVCWSLIALLNQRATAEPLGQASLHAAKADAAARSRWRATRRSSTPWGC